ncbi:unnamed protein product, partial [Laminaria digitata]
SSTVAVNITSTTDVQNLTDALDCTGEGSFDITWYPSVTIVQRIEVSNKKSVTVTGIDLPSIRGKLADDNGADAIADAAAGLFSVTNGSTLSLNNLVLEGGKSEYGGAVEVHSSSSLFVFGCSFANNT